MSTGFIRSGQRLPDQLRNLRVEYNIFTYAAGSTLFEMGKTKVLCAVSLQQGVPHFLRGKKNWMVNCRIFIITCLYSHKNS
jgi:ribonuclease PH